MHLFKKNFFTLNHAIFVGLMIGLIIGLFFPYCAGFFKPFQTLFFNGIQCIIAPLLFGTLVTGIAGIGNIRTLGKLGLRCMIYFELVTTAALFFGLLVVNFLKPGQGVSFGVGGGTDVPMVVESNLSLAGIVGHLLPSNIAQPILNGDILQIVVFSTLFALGVLMVGEKAKSLFDFCESLTEVMLKVTSFIMWLTPLAVIGAISGVLAEHGWKIMLPMVKLIATSYIALIGFVLCVFLPILWFYKISVSGFFVAMRSALMVGFATTSSEAAYPLLLKGLDQMGVPMKITRFVLPLGYSFNLDGSTLYLSVVLIFVAQAANVTLSLYTQLVMMFSLMLTTKGVAAVPRATLIVLSGTLASFGLPIEGVALIMAVDHIMDMARTFVNVLGNSIAAVVMYEIEKKETKKS